MQDEESPTTATHPPVGDFSKRDDFSSTNNAPISCSVSFDRYFTEHLRIVNFLFFITTQVTRIDDMARHAAKALISISEPDEINEKYRKSLEVGAGATDALRRQRDIFIEMLICRSVDNYLTYISDILFEIFLTKNETLRSSETERLDFILSHSSMPDLIQSIAERKVHELSYKGMEDLSKYFFEKLGVNIFENPDDKTITIDLIQKRNLIVHNRGLANAIYISKTKGLNLKVGERVIFETDQFFQHLDGLCGAAIHLDQKCIEKFNLPKISRSHSNVQF